MSNRHPQTNFTIQTPQFTQTPPQVYQQEVHRLPQQLQPGFQQPIHQQVHPQQIRQLPAHMPYNEHYQHRLSTQLGPVIASERPTMQNYHQQNVNGNNSRMFNVDATPFQPGVRYVPQAQPQVPAYSPYASYLNDNSNAFGAVNNQHVQQRYRPSVPANYSSYNTVQQPVYNNFPQQQQQFVNPNVAAYYNPNQLASMSAPQQQQQQPQPQQPAQSSNDEVSMYPLSAELVSKIQNCRNKKAIVEVQIGLEQLVSDPHEYETWAYAIKSRISYNITSQELEIIGWIIVEMSFLCPNSQYNFSRLCKAIESEANNFTSTTILPRIANIISNTLENLSDEQIGDLALFVAELYDKIEVNGVRLSRLGQYLVDLLRVLLDIDPLTDPLVKNVVQSLKLVGRLIEDDQDPACLNEIFDKLEFVRQNSRAISESAKNSIRQVVQLREKQWGMRSELIDSSNTFPLNETGSEYTQYGPDGVPLTEEERAFLEENCRFLDSSGCEEDDFGVEYEQYLRDQTEATAVSAAEKALEKLNM